MRIVKKANKKSVKASCVTRKPLKAVKADEQVEDVEAPEDPEAPEAEVAPEATELLFETEDVAQLLAEVTDEDVTVDVDDDTDEIVFTVADEEYTVAPDGEEELLEASTRIMGKKRVSAASKLRKRPMRRR